MINKFLNKNISKILIIFLYLQPVIDLLTSISLNILNLDISFGVIVRILFLLFLLYFYLFVKKSIDKKSLIYLGSLFIFLIIYSVMIITLKDTSALFYELQNVIKLIYLPILLIIVKDSDIKIDYKDLVKIACIYLIFICLPTIFGLQFNSYSQGKTGSVGWFNSGNEISAILSILTPFLIYYLFKKNNLIKKILLIILIGYTYFIIGSKIIIISLLLSIIFNIILYFKNNKVEKKKILKYSLIGVFIIIIGIILIPRTNFYQNIVIHLNYLGINSIKDVFSFNFINRFIFSDRLTYLLNTNLNYIWSEPIEKFFGIGFIESYGTDFVYLKTIEMDFFDIFYRTGIFGFIIIMYPIVKALIMVFKKNYHSSIKFAIILGLVIAMLVGHTIVSPGVSIYLLYLFKTKEVES